MDNFIRQKAETGLELTVSDCRVWAEIHYLDSPTDYREYLLACQSRAPVAADTRRRPPTRSRSPQTFVFVLLACMIVIAWLLLQLLKNVW